MLTREMSGINLQKHSIFVTCSELKFYLLIVLLTSLSTTDAVTLTGSSEYAVPGNNFTLTCDVPDEAIAVSFYHRPDASTPVGSVQVGGSQCYNPPDLCTPDVCSCVSTSTGGRGTVFRWVIQPQTGDHGSVWFCKRTNLKLTDQILDSPDFTLSVADGPGTSLALSPQDTLYTRNEGETLPDITCTADCRPGCTFVWTKPDNTNFTASAVLSLGQLDRSKHGTYRCTAWNVIGTSGITTSVNVHYGPGDSITFKSESDVLDSIENQTIPEMLCSADCRPPCTYIWSKAGRGYPNPLSLYVATRNNAGQYTCTADNIVSKGTKTWNLIVRFPPRLPSLSYTQGDGNVTENGPKSLICRVESYPPSTIHWYYKANNSLLLATPDVLESTYTLTTAGCLDTGLYTCSARNSVSNTAVTRDTYINVLCKPRPYQIPKDYQTFEFALLETLTILAMFISNPEPVFTWTFQLTPLTCATELVNGADNFAIKNSFQMINLSAVSEGTRTNIQDNWFGLYNVTATNSQGSAMVSYTVRAQRDPSFPIILSVDCRQPKTAEVSWKDGGNSKFYRVLFSSNGFLNSKQVYPLTIPYEVERSNIYSLYVDNLEGERLYSFKIAAYNEHGNTTSIEAVGCTVREELSSATDNMYVTGVSLTCTGVFTLLLTVGLGIFISRYGRLPFIKRQHLKHREFQKEQLSEQDVAPPEEEERSSYEQLDMNAIAKPSIYSEIGSHPEESTSLWRVGRIQTYMMSPTV
ncbi:hemicentin-2-like isoform X2 [Mizuhopecten yessoensis]|uniref:hemicentin-2-like isoform X2 n=1 Tax=Mizuhopecten yessoensis TaxID=6573 RepID=UPI000B45DEC6|nr:hemicentin-2-like isoform X2 [Mizuhopecten yessoensis]